MDDSVAVFPRTPHVTAFCGAIAVNLCRHCAAGVLPRTGRANGPGWIRRGRCQVL